MGARQQACRSTSRHQRRNVDVGDHAHVAASTLRPVRTANVEVTVLCPRRGDHPEGRFRTRVGVSLKNKNWRAAADIRHESGWEREHVRDAPAA